MLSEPQALGILAIFLLVLAAGGFIADRMEVKHDRNPRVVSIVSDEEY